MNNLVFGKTIKNIIKHKKEEQQTNKKRRI